MWCTSADFFVATCEQHAPSCHNYIDFVTTTTPLTTTAQAASVKTMGSSKKLTTTTRPLRRSARILQRNATRLPDLPQELRDMICALVIEEAEEFRLIDGLKGTAKALSRVCRVIRADATRIFFSKNSFLVTIGFAAGSKHFKGDLWRLGDWCKVWGGVALPHIRSLKLFDDMRHLCGGRISIRLKDAAKPVEYGDHPGYSFTFVRESDMNRIALAVFNGHGEQAITGEQLLTFLAAVQEAMAEVHFKSVTGTLRRLE